MNEPTGQALNEHPVAGVDRTNGAVVVHLTGELDLYNAPIVRTTLFDLADEGPERLVVDLGNVDFIDSTALGVLIETRSRLPNRGFMLAPPGIETHRALRVSGLDQHLAVHESVAAALASAVP